MFSYPLTPVPLSLAQLDGTMNKTDKAKLMHALEDRVTSNVPQSTPPPAPQYVSIQDAMFLIQGLVEVPATFGGIAKIILRKLCSSGDGVHFICDRYPNKSIKGDDRVKCMLQRNVQALYIKMTELDQRRQNSSTHYFGPVFEISFVKFLANE